MTELNGEIDDSIPPPLLRTLVPNLWVATPIGVAKHILLGRRLVSKLLKCRHVCIESTICKQYRQAK